MKILLLILFSIFLFSGHIFVDNVFSQQEITITAQTTKDSYDAGETVTVGGTIQNYDYSSNSNIAVTYQTKDPSGNLVTIGQASPNTKGIFSFNFETGGSLYKESGQYTIQLIFNSVKKDIVFSYKGGSFEATEPESSSKPPPPDESKISIEIPGDATFFLNSPNQIIRAYVEIPNFAPSDGTYFMKVTHILSQKVLKDFEIYPKNFGNDIWGVNVAYPLQRTDVTFGEEVLTGQYELQIRNEKGSKTGSTKFSIYQYPSDVPLPKSEINNTSPEKVNTNPEKSQKVPLWIKNMAGWWGQDAIGDSEFISGIQFLINEGIMIIPETTKTQSEVDSKEIPSWIKNNADWWSQGKISDEDFVTGIQYLVSNGIISIN